MRGFLRVGLACAVGASALACGGGDETEQRTGAPMRNEAPATAAAETPNRPPVIQRLWLDPDSPQPGEQIEALLDASDPDGDNLKYSYEWTVNGHSVAGERVLQVPRAAKGTQIEVRVVPHDGTNEGAAASASATIGNQAPVMVGVVIEPLGDVTVENDVIAKPHATDVDGDSLSFEYQWWVNGTWTHGDGAVLGRDRFRRGDRLELEVVANDGSDRSDPLRSDTFKVGNAAPRITSTPGNFDAEGVFRYEVAADDPDGDRRFRFQLLEGPAGMSIDGRKGLVSWEPGEKDAGEHAVVVEVDDMAGGKASQHFQVKVGFDAAQPPAAAETP